MKERPILFSAPMVRAILEGRKTQTRRPITCLPGFGPVTEFGRSDTPGYDWRFRDQRERWNEITDTPHIATACPYGVPGDRLWGRETFAIRADLGRHVEYRASHQEPANFPFAHIYDEHTRWSPSIHMPRWASRLTLEVTDVRVQRVQDISEQDARAEGITDGGCLNCGGSEPCVCRYPKPDARDGFAGLWDSINASRGFGWLANPWVWAITFEVRSI